MPKIEFENESFKSRKIFGAPRTPKMIKVVMKVFHFSNERSAGIFLLSIAVLFFILSIAILIYTIKGPSFEKAKTNDNLPKKVRMALPPHYAK